MNQNPNQTNALANRLMKEIDYYNQDQRKRRELMDYATRLLDERLIGKKEGVRNMIIALKANNADNNFILKVVKMHLKKVYPMKKLMN